MKIARRVILALVLLASIGAWIWLSRLADGYREEPYTLIEEGLYVGGSVTEPPPGTRAVLNLCDRKDPYEVEACLTDVIADGYKSPGVDWLRRMVEFVDAQRTEGRTTYIHCNAGVSRSGLVITAYVMSRHHWGRDKALAYVRSKRPQIQPNSTFMQLLAELEAVLKEQEK
jgi:hypothetical protein